MPLSRGIAFIVICGGLTACQNMPEKAERSYQPSPSFIAGAPEKEIGVVTAYGIHESEAGNIKDKKKVTASGYQTLPPLEYTTKANSQGVDLTEKFSDQKMVKLSSDALSLVDFIHYSLGEILGVSYILGEEVKVDRNPITLNLQSEITQRRLYTLTEELLLERGYGIRFNEGVFYINKEQEAEKNKSNAYGYGRTIDTVPNSSQSIIQYVPMKYAVSSSMIGSITGIANVRAFTKSEPNVIELRGKRNEIIKALDIIDFLDSPALRGRKVSLYKTTYMPVGDIITTLSNILANEGIKAGENNGTEQTLAMIPLEHNASVLLFAYDQFVLNRAAFWLKKLDQPTEGAVPRYFTFQPKFARATDIAESIQPLLTGVSSSTKVSNKTSAKSESQTTGSKTVGKPNSVMSSSTGLRLVVDERTNALIVYGTGVEYQRILPLIKRMDVMPKQVLLEVMIAEVTLTDEFKLGVEFAFSNGDFSLGNKGGFGVEKFGGLALGIKGTDGEIVANALQSNSLVNVLSRPSLVVRDGVSASINIGTDLPVIGETTSDPDGDRQTTSISYRKTGIDLSVTPTINAQGVVLMEISQKSSNQVDTGGTTVGDSPAIFERSIDTEVVADSGQTIVLGGLMSENKTTGETKVPLLGDLPWVGQLFRGNSDKSTKTELVVLVTPRVIESSMEWNEIKSKLDASYQHIELPIK